MGRGKGLSMDRRKALAIIANKEIWHRHPQKTVEFFEKLENY